MKEIKKEIKVKACEICGEEISEGTRPIEVVDNWDGDEDAESYYFHEECSDKLLIETAKKLKKQNEN